MSLKPGIAFVFFFQVLMMLLCLHTLDMGIFANTCSHETELGSHGDNQVYTSKFIASPGRLKRVSSRTRSPNPGSLRASLVTFQLGQVVLEDVTRYGNWFPSKCFLFFLEFIFKRSFRFPTKLEERYRDFHIPPPPPSPDT